MAALDAIDCSIDLPITSAQKTGAVPAARVRVTASSGFLRPSCSIAGKPHTVRGGTPVAMRTAGAARAHGPIRTANGQHLRLPNVSRVNVCPLLTACLRVYERRVPVLHDVENFASCESHSDI